ncbi:MAG: hypothetical protein CTY12_06855 [Methylotenera sp.]|nr:MAG: hypothetical protein CTY14_06835 [Methylotenera sp.]PPD52206.1 MAG: hypothetical protein CTY12_06855 [Methylotenera sp.]
MEKNISAPKLVPPSVGFIESDASTANTPNESSVKAANSVQLVKPVAKKAPSLRKKISPREASQMPFKVYVAYDKPVDLSGLLDEISEVICTFVIVDDLQADAAALWVFHTYLVEIFDTSPILIINAPERACAKTLFQTVLVNLSARALPASNATASSLFRSVELWMPSIFFDEADTFFKDNNDLLGMVNAGYKSSGFVLRSEKVEDSFIPKKFPVYGAKSIAGIALEKHLHDSTMSRGIILNMRRKLPDEKVTRLRYAEQGLFEKLCVKIVRAADDYEEAIQDARPHLPEELSDRAQDNWEPLLAIATVAGEGWLERAIKAALTLSRQSNEKGSTGNELLADIQLVFEKRTGEDQYADKISSAELISELQAIEESPWATYNHGYPISPRQIAGQLVIYGIKPKTVRVGKFDTPKGYELRQFNDAFARYLSPADKEAVADEMIDLEAVQDEEAPAINPMPIDPSDPY